MHELKLENVIDTLLALGIQKGDGLLVHSAVQYLGLPEGGLGMYYEAFNSVLNLTNKRTESQWQSSSNQGTLAVPTFTFAFARGEAYDPQSTPSAGMGAFSEFIRQLPEARRTKHPMQSLAILGRWTDDLSHRDTLSAFDPGSAFERMLELNFQLLLLGADIQAVSLIHYSEQKANVPYRFWKDFPGIRKAGSERENCTYRMFARDLSIDPHLNLHPVQIELQKRGQWNSQTLNYGQVSIFRISDFIRVADEFLEKDPWVFVEGHR